MQVYDCAGLRLSHCTNAGAVEMFKVLCVIGAHYPERLASAIGERRGRREGGGVENKSGRERRGDRTPA